MCFKSVELCNKRRGHVIHPLPPYTSTLPIPTSPCPASLPSLFLPTPTDLIAVSGAGGYDNIVTGPTDKVVTPGEILIMDTGTQKRSDENRDENREAMRNEGSRGPKALLCAVCVRAQVCCVVCRCITILLLPHTY